MLHLQNNFTPAPPLQVGFALCSVGWT